MFICSQIAYACSCRVDLVSENDHVCAQADGQAKEMHRQRHIAHTRRMPATDVPANRLTLAFLFFCCCCFVFCIAVRGGGAVAK